MHLQYDGETLTDLVRAHITVESGEVAGFSVMYNTVVDGREHTVVRYDCSHGFAHRDELYREKPKKTRLPAIGLESLVGIAMDEIEGNWKAYKNQFMRNNKIGEGRDDRQKHV
jgi:hypothetical protein